MQIANRCAPAGPGIPARWTSNAKIGVGTALGNKSRVWFTLGHGIYNEIYYPRIDQGCVRDMGLIETDGADFFSEEKHGAERDGRLFDLPPVIGKVQTSSFVLALCKVLDLCLLKGEAQMKNNAGTERVTALTMVIGQEKANKEKNS